MAKNTDTPVARAKAVRDQMRRRSNAAGPHGVRSRRTERRDARMALRSEAGR